MSGRGHSGPSLLLRVYIYICIYIYGVTIQYIFTQAHNVSLVRTITDYSLVELHLRVATLLKLIQMFIKTSDEVTISKKDIFT